LDRAGPRQRIRQVAEKPVFAVFAVIPAKAGIQSFLGFLDSRLRGSDGGIVFSNNLTVYLFSF
jgi:hypothetical protein